MSDTTTELPPATRHVFSAGIPGVLPAEYEWHGTAHGVDARYRTENAELRLYVRAVVHDGCWFTKLVDEVGTIYAMSSGPKLNDVNDYRVEWTNEGYELACPTCGDLLGSSAAAAWTTLADILKAAREHLDAHLENDHG